jgi:hypothetical protein
MGDLLPDQRGRSDRQFTRDAAIGSIMAGSANLSPASTGQFCTALRGDDEKLSGIESSSRLG